MMLQEQQQTGYSNQTAQLIPKRVTTLLGSHIARCYEEAKTAKLPVIERLLKCERQRRGEYEPDLKAQIAQSGGQEIFMMITDIKCRAADAWIKDVMMNHSESTWALQPTVEADLPIELKAEVEAVVIEEAAQVAAAGIPVDKETMRARRAEIEEEVRTKVRETAEQRAKRMETRITDKLTEGNLKSAQSALIYDFTTYPAAFVKGPVLRMRKRAKWGPNFQRVIEETPVIEVERVSPWDIFPSPGAVSIQDGYLIRRHMLSRKAIKQMERLPGADKQAIEQVLLTYRTGLQNIEYGDSEHQELNGNELHWKADGMIEALEYWGPAPGFMLREWGMTSVNGKTIDETDEYQIMAWKIGPYVIQALLNPDPLDKRPYSKACFEEIPGAFWGKALPEMMADVQVMCNAAARGLASNMGIASGPQVEVHVDRLAAGESVTNMYPWKIWQTTSDRTGNGQPAVRFFQPSMNAQELLTIFSHFSKIADEVTGVPNYIYGSSNVSGAGRTASGLAMLMENAAKGIKHAILSLDAAMSEVIVRTYDHLMEYDPDPSIKGDCQIVAAGAIGAMIREQQLLARKEFLAETANPIDAQIIGLEGRAYMLREHGKTIFPDINKVVPSPERMRQMQADAQAQAQMQAAQAAQAPQAAGAPVAA